MTFLKTTLRAAAATAILAGSGFSAFAQDVTLKLHQFLPAQANVPKLVLDVWADKVEADSAGRIKIERFPSMQLGGKPNELADQVVDGVADIIWTVAGYTPGRFPQAEVFELPFMMTNAEATSRAYWQMAEANMMDTDFKELKMLGTWVHGPGVIHANRPVHKVADLAGLKLRAPTRIITGMLSDLGATPIGMPVPAIPEALSKGVIDGAVIPWEVTPSLKLTELVHHHTEFGGEALYTTSFIFAMNKEKYESLPDDLKKVIDDNSGLEFSAFAGMTQAAADGPSRDLAVQSGNEIITLNEDQVAEWREAAKGSEARWIKEMNDAGLDGQALVDQARALIAENTK